MALADDLARVLRLLSQDFDEGVLSGYSPVNVSPKQNGEPLWDEELKARMLALEAPAIERFYGDDSFLNP